MSDDLACWTCGTRAAHDLRYPDVGYVRCPSCELLFQPHSSRERLREIYRPDYFADYGLGGPYDEDEAQRRRDAEVRVRWVRQAAAPVGRLLEIGCASGWFLAAARTVGYDVVGIEPAEEMASASRERSRSPVQATMIEDAALPAASFDVAVAWHVLEHLAEPRGTLAAVRGALKPGGRLLLELPNVAALWAVRQGEDWYALEPQHHVAHYTPRALDALLRAAGFEPEAIESVHPGTLLVRRQAFGPRGLAFHVKESLAARAWIRSAHPWKFDLLRAVARVP